MASEKTLRDQTLLSAVMLRYYALNILSRECIVLASKAKRGDLYMKSELFSLFHDLWFYFMKRGG